jgi:hypothetical protein
LRPGGELQLLHPIEYARSGVHDAVAGALGPMLASRSEIATSDGLLLTTMRKAALLLLR